MPTASWGAAALLAVFLACGDSARPASKEAAENNRGGWTATAVTGIPAEAELWDVAVKEGVFVATGRLPGTGIDDLMAVWRSTDGVNWTEVHRDQYLQGGDGPPSARVASGPSGFAVVGASCDSGCQPVALTSADGRAWTPGDVRRRPALRGATGARLLRGTPSVFYEGAALLDVIDSGGWLAVGWMQAGNHDAEPAVWRTRDAGATWEPIPPDAIPPGGRRADHMERVIVWSGHLLVSGLSHEQSGGISDRLWLSAGEDKWRSIPAPAAWRLREMASLWTGEAFIAGTPSEQTRGAVWRSETKDGEWQRSSDPGLANVLSVSGLHSSGTGLVLFGAERGPIRERSSDDVPALWGSPDGIHWLATLRLDGPVEWSTAIATTDAWFIYGVTREGQQRRQTVWRTTPRCATAAATCPA